MYSCLCSKTLWKKGVLVPSLKDSDVICILSTESSFLLLEKRGGGKVVFQFKVLYKNKIGYLCSFFPEREFNLLKEN